MPNPTPSTAAASSRAERIRAWVEKLAAAMDPDFPSTFATDPTFAAVDDGGEVYGTEHGGRPAMVVADDAKWRG